MEFGPGDGIDVQRAGVVQAEEVYLVVQTIRVIGRKVLRLAVEGEDVDRPAV